MARLRLFANLREIAGTGRMDVPADTISELIETVNGKFGPDFSRGVESARVWLNGEEAHPADVLADTDEVVLLPPVSGGGQPATLAPVDLLGFAPLVVIVVAWLANSQSEGQEIWAATLVGIASVWALDIGAAFAIRAKPFAPLAVAAAAASGALTAHVLGTTGYGLSVALAVAIALGWSVAFKSYREVDAVAPTVLVSLLAALGSASLVLARSGFVADERAIDVFLVSTIAGVGLGSIVSRLRAMPLLDPFSVTAIGAALSAIGAAAVWGLDIIPYLLVGLGVAVSLVAGQGLASMLRTGKVHLSQRPAGVLASIDGVVLAAAVYYPIVQLIL